VLGMQAPTALQLSSPLQALPSAQLVPAGMGACVTPVVGLQASSVQGFSSLIVGGVPALQEPLPSHVSVPLQRSPSPQLVPSATGSFETPVTGSHASIVHGFESSTSDGAPATQVPEGSQTSGPLQRSASAQLVPSGTGSWWIPATGSQLSAVHALESSSAGGVPGLQMPVALQTSAPLHTFASAQLVPAGSGAWVMPPCSVHASAVHGF